ncbi:MAG: GntR family transcriptional regulator [Clostridiales bacterium]|nr:GntR family transcriptional regulator [Clostridiales bacterium]
MITDCHIDKNTPIPLYYQLKTILLDQIKSGEYESGDLIPTEAELSAMFDISRTTVRQAIAELVQEGYLYRIPSKGTYVSKPSLTLHISESVYTFLNDVKESGNLATSEILKMEIIPITQDLLDAGAGVAGDRAIYLYRKRYLNGMPLNRAISTLVYKKFTGLMDADLEKQTLRQIMDADPQTKVMRWKRIVEAVPAEAEDVRLLGAKLGAPMQKMTTIRYNRDDEVLDISYAYYRGELSRMEVQVVNDNGQ